MNIKGEYAGIAWSGFARQRAGRRREFILKYKGVQGWRPMTAPAEVTSEAKFRTWALVELRKIAELGETPKNNADPTTVAALYEKWIVLRENDPRLDGGTVKNSRNHFRSRILPRWGSTPVGALDSRDGQAAIRDWVRALSTEVGADYCKNVVSTFSTFFRDIDLEGWVTIRANPVKTPRVRTVLPQEETRRVIVTLPADVAQGLLAPHPKTRLRDRIRYALGLCCGANDGELSGCQILHVLDLRGSAPTLEILQAFKLSGNRLAKENGKRGAALGKTKNKFRMRPIPLNDCARDALIEWLDYGWEEFVGRPWVPTDPLLPSSVGKFSRARATIRRDLERLGLPTHDHAGRPFEFRTLRRTFSTLLRAAKVDKEIRERLMGQSSRSINTEHYTADVPEELRDAVRRLPLSWPHGGAVVPRLGGGGNLQPKSASGLQCQECPTSSRLSTWSR